MKEKDDPKMKKEKRYKKKNEKRRLGKNKEIKGRPRKKDGEKSRPK